MIDLTRTTYDEVVSRASDADGREVCGALAGDDGAEAALVTDVYPADNAAATPETRYAIDPEELFEIVERIESEGRDVVGFYHSHPAGPPRPSETDADRAAWTGYSYVIVALDGQPYVGSWRWRGAEDGFEQELIRVTADDHRCE